MENSDISIIYLDTPLYSAAIQAQLHKLIDVHQAQHCGVRGVRRLLQNVVHALDNVQDRLEALLLPKNHDTTWHGLADARGRQSPLHTGTKCAIAFAASVRSAVVVRPNAAGLAVDARDDVFRPVDVARLKAGHGKRARTTWEAVLLATAERVFGVPFARVARLLVRARSLIKERQRGRHARLLELGLHRLLCALDNRLGIH